MKNNKFDYEMGFMCPIDVSIHSYKKNFNQDYRLRNLTKVVKDKSGKLIDFGCGGGTTTEALSYYYPKMSIYGSDISNNAINHAKKYGSGKIKYCQIKNNKIPYKSNSFDVCVSLDVLEHVDNLDAVLNEMYRLLKKQGKLFIVVPCEGQPFTYTWFFRKLHIGENLTKENFGHIHPEYTHKYIINKLKEHNFKIEDIAYTEHILYQVNHLLVFFIPKKILEIIFGKKKIKEYAYSSLYWNKKSNSDPLMIMKIVWEKIKNLLLMYPMDWETIICRRIPYFAWKLNILVSKK